ncbi:MAG: bifunctional (p)ppGpp synthetase/guanosine-3',5'-bis(diphosphate) 3'-pyrophosphohydrolase [Candidatus Hydrogenedentes bacterium]|nr:bifunctional (p)ppGpp synthetase/guanosine-3',5'-bis(diphosphate) 3'-pyrophosphohydrolase [Candidatus Hydrogenedentota bacterium]
MRTEFAKLLKSYKRTHPGQSVDLIRKAYRVANEAHHTQPRLSGEPYITHPLAVALILDQLHLDSTTIAAGLLHDVLEDTPMTRAELAEEFGEEIAALVDGVSKTKNIKWTTGQTRQQKQAENLRKMLVATAQDVRVILIKLADRLHNMRTIEHIPQAKRRERIARETLDIFAPLAHRLGIARWKWELEDHAFHELYPDDYRDMARLVAVKRREREADLEMVIAYLEERLTEAEVSTRVIGRPKHLYSIYQKMMQQGKDFEQVMDILALRIVTQTVSGCYNALGVVHHLWPPMPGRFKDYIATPKANMYQSIHTTVMRENGQALEVQIRTEEMDRTAREGIAAHWRYKEGKSDRKLDTQLNWLRQMYEWLQDDHSPDELLDNVRRDVTVSDIYVFTPKGEVKELPKGATPLDFAYNVHSDVGHHCIGARVNGRIVPLRYNLQLGDVVEILTSRNQTPHLDWLETVVTGKARTRIRQRLREMNVIEPLDGQIRRHEVRALPEVRTPVRHVDDATRQKLVLVEGAKGVAVNFAKCCGPMPGHPIIGYITKSAGVSIHRADCGNFTSTERDTERMVTATWVGDHVLEVSMRAVTSQRPNLLADITNAVRPMNISINVASFQTGENGKSSFDFVFEAPDYDYVARVARSILTVSGVAHVETVDVNQVLRK